MAELKLRPRFRLRHYLSDFGMVMAGVSIGFALSGDWVRGIALMAFPAIAVGLGLLRDYKGIDIRLCE